MAEEWEVLGVCFCPNQEETIPLQSLVQTGLLRALYLTYLCISNTREHIKLSLLTAPLHLAWHAMRNLDDLTAATLMDMCLFKPTTLSQYCMLDIGNIRTWPNQFCAHMQKKRKSLMKYKTFMKTITKQ